MITQEAAEKFLKSKLALFMLMMAVIVFLMDWNLELRKTIISNEASASKSDSIHRLENFENAKIIYNIQQQQKIERDNALQAERYRTEKFENLYIRVMQVEEAAKKHKIMK